MSGAFAHLTLANEVSEPRFLEALGFSSQTISIVNEYLPFCQLGAVSPDLPYLAIPNGGQAGWSELMHYEKTGEIIKSAIPFIKKLNGKAKEKCIAWLLGYTAHVGMDLTIHPIIQLMVGEYKGHETEHRQCEMNQDTHAWQRMNLGPQGLSAFLKPSIMQCCKKGKEQELDGDIHKLWLHMLKRVYGKRKSEPEPDMNSWFKGFVFVVNTCLQANHLCPAARHVCVQDYGATYPLPNETDQKFIQGLPIPDASGEASGEVKDYDDIFMIAKKNVASLWTSIILAVENGDAPLIGDYSLDTGLKIGEASKTQAFWPSNAT
ncbi:MAG: zinc dependent phospholipase C family protein [Bdellovibrionales bacterium]